MQTLPPSDSDGVRQQDFVVDTVPGTLWHAVDAVGPRPLILVGHGGGAHRSHPSVIGRARHYVTANGFAVAAIDAPGHGARPRGDRETRIGTVLRERIARGESVASDVARYHDELAAEALADWQLALDHLCSLPVVDAGRIGYWGVSLGSGIGLPLVAAEPRIRAAVFGLIGHDTIAAFARRITVPVLFLLQWDDQLVARDSALALFDALGTAEKTLHANPGGHGEVPSSEVESSERFFQRHLTAPASPRPGVGATDPG